MTFARYYAELLRRSEEGAPTAVEAQRDFQRVVQLSHAALGFAV